jgi:hypothetical protein
VVCDSEVSEYVGMIWKWLSGCNSDQGQRKKRRDDTHDSLSAAVDDAIRQNRKIGADRQRDSRVRQTSSYTTAKQRKVLVGFAINCRGNRGARCHNVPIERERWLCKSGVGGSQRRSEHEKSGNRERRD